MEKAILLVFVSAIVVDAITDLLFSPASIVHEKLWSKVQAKFWPDNWIGKLVTCPYCFSLWIALLFSVNIWHTTSERLLFGLAIWRVADFSRLLYKIILKQSILD